MQQKISQIFILFQWPGAYFSLCFYISAHHFASTAHLSLSLPLFCISLSLSLPLYLSLSLPLSLSLSPPLSLSLSSLRLRMSSRVEISSDGWGREGQGWTARALYREIYQRVCVCVIVCVCVCVLCATPSWLFFSTCWYLYMALPMYYTALPQEM